MRLITRVIASRSARKLAAGAAAVLLGGCQAVAITAAGIGLAKQQALQRPIGASAGGFHQRGNAMAIARIDFGAGTDQHLNQLAVRVQRGNMQSAATELVGGMHIGPRLQ